MAGHSAAPDAGAAASSISEVVRELHAKLGERLVAVYRYGAPVTGARDDEDDDGELHDGGARRLLVLVDRVDLTALRKSGRPSVAARKLGLRVRLDTVADVVGSADTHPVFALSLIDGRELLHGDDVLSNLTVHPGDLRLHVEQALRNLVHELSDGYLHAPKNEQRIATLLRRCGRRLVYLLEALLILEGHLEAPSGSVHPPRAADAIIATAGELLGAAEGELLDRLWSHADRDQTLSGETLYAIFGATLDLLRALVTRADAH